MVQKIAADVHEPDFLESLDVPPAEVELLRFAKKLTEASYQTSREDIDRLRQADWSDDQIAEAVWVVGMFNMFNRVADAFGLEDPGYFDQDASQPQIQPATRHQTDPDDRQTEP